MMFRNWSSKSVFSLFPALDTAESSLRQKRKELLALLRRGLRSDKLSRWFAGK